MEFRPCIDIHNGRVKQIVGGSLTDQGNSARVNFVSDKNAEYYARLYKEKNLTGGHVILLNGKDSEYYDASRKEAFSALEAYPGGLQVGGGINADNAEEYIKAGASHVIVTSYVFADGVYHEDRLEKLAGKVGRNHLVLDLSCRFVKGKYVIVTDRWQKSTDIELNIELFKKLSDYCEEFLVHAVNVEGTGLGVDEGVLEILGKANQTVTYAGGISALEDIDIIRKYGNGRVNFTIGSCLDIFGGGLKLEEVIKCTR